MTIEKAVSNNNPNWSTQKIEPEFATVREFSKQHYSDRRQERADNIRQERTSYFSHKEGEKKSATERLPKREEEKLIMLEDIKQTEKSLERTAKKLRLSIFEKIVGPRKHLESFRARAQENSEYLKEYLEKQVEGLREIESQIKWLDATIRDTVRSSAFIQLRENIRGDIDRDNQFYGRQHEEYEKKRDDGLRHTLRLLEEDLERTIEHFITKENVVFVHGTHPSFDPSENSAIVDGLSWDQKARLAIGLEPTLSTSSVRPGQENFENIFAGVGVVIGKGKIEYADTSDADTVPTSLTEFKIRKPFVGGTREITEQDTPTLDYISYILKNGPRKRQNMKHNEIVVSRPKAVGIYFVADDITDEVLKVAYIVPDHKEIEDFSKEMNLPVFAFKDGQFYPAVFDPEANSYTLDESQQLSSESFIEMPGVTEEKRNAIIENARSKQADLFKFPLD